MGYRIRHLREDRGYPFVVEERLLWHWRLADTFTTQAGAEAFVADRERPRIIWRSGDPPPATPEQRVSIAIAEISAMPARERANGEAEPQ